MDSTVSQEVSMSDMWTPFKHLQLDIETAITRTSNDSYTQLVKLLQKNRKNFLSLLQNPCKKGLDTNRLAENCPGGLPSELAAETLILADMFNLDEYMALNLLATAQFELVNYPGMTRGCVAAMLYHDGRKALVWSLRTIAATRQGRSWVPDTSSELIDILTRYFDQLVSDGLIETIIGLLGRMCVESEVDLLDKNRALGSSPYRQQTIDLISSTRTALADIIFLYSAQTCLPHQLARSLLDFLKKMKTSEKEEMDCTSQALVMAFLYYLDLPDICSEELVRDFGWLEGSEWLQKSLGSQGDEWASPELHALFSMVWATAISAFQSQPCNFSLKSSVVLENPDAIMKRVLNKNVFVYLEKSILSCKSLFEEDFYMKIMHNVFTNFILFMPLTIKEMRHKSVEAHLFMQKNLEIKTKPALPFEEFLLAMAKFYSSETRLHLCDEFWLASTNSVTPSKKAKSQALFNFLISTGENLFQAMFVPYVKFLTGVSSSPTGASSCFALLKDIPECPLRPSWNHFFTSLSSYLYSLTSEIGSGKLLQQDVPKSIKPQELAALHAVLELIKTVSRSERSSGEGIGWSERYGAVRVLVGLVNCASLGPDFKAAVLECLAAITSASMPLAASVRSALDSAPQLTSTILNDIDVVESRNGKYPVSRGWLSLMLELAKEGLPWTLSSIYEIDPLFRFSADCILVKVFNRRFIREAEKWELCKAGMGLVAMLVKQYSPGQTASFSSGYFLMSKLCSDTPLLKLCLRLLSEGTLLFDTFTNFPGKEDCRSALLSVLQCFEHTLRNERALLAGLGASSAVHFQGLSRHLQSTNPLSNSPDYLLSISKFVMYGWWEETLAAVKLLLAMCSFGDQPRSLLLALFTESASLRISLRHGFVTLLESADSAPEVTEAKLTVSSLLLNLLSLPGPNLAHFLLGFDMHKPLSKTVFQQPGVTRMPRTCLHSLISELNGNLTNKDRSPTVVCSYYRLIHALSIDSKTSEPVLRFFRTIGFISTHLSALPFSNLPSAIEKEQMSWILKTIAVELKVTASNKLCSELSSLIKRFIGGDFDDTNDCRSVPSQIMFDLVNCITFNPEPVPRPKLDYFDYDCLVSESTLKSLTVKEGLVEIVDLKELKKTLQANITAFLKFRDSCSHKALLEKEGEVILGYMGALNEQLQLKVGNKHLLKAWSQVTEIMFSVVPVEVLPNSRRISLIVEIMHQLLSKVLWSDKENPLHQLVSETLLLLSVDLRRCFSLEDAGSKSSPNASSKPALEGSLQLYADKLSDIITLLGKWILFSGCMEEKERVSLYVCLVNLVNLSEQEGSHYQGLRQSDPVYTALTNLLSQGDRFLRLLAQDSTFGHDMTKMVSLSVLNLVVEVGGDSWCEMLSRAGLLKLLADTILASDHLLMALLVPTTSSLRPLFLYQSTMAFLCRVARNKVGAELLVRLNFLSYLSSMQVYDKHPQIISSYSSQPDEDEFMLSVTSRYLQILTPALLLCQAVTSSLGTSHSAATSQVVDFLIGHGEMVSQVLRCGSPNLSLPFLKELSLIVGVISTTASYRKENGFERLEKLRPIILSLLSRFIPSESMFRQLKGDPDSHSPLAEREPIITYLKITSYLVFYAKNLVSDTGTDSRQFNTVLHSSLSDVDWQMPQQTEVEMNSGSEATLGSVVCQLRGAVSHHQKEKTTLDILQNQLKLLPEMTTSSMKELFSERLSSVNDLNECHRLAYTSLSQEIEAKEKELELCSFIISLSVFIVWAHIDSLTLSVGPKVKQKESSATSFDGVAQLRLSLHSVFSTTFTETLLSTAKDKENRAFLNSMVALIVRLSSR